MARHSPWIVCFGLAIFTAQPSARACAYADAHGLVLGSTTAALLPLPLNGVIVLPAWSFDMSIEEALGFVTVTLSHDGVEIPGAFEAVELRPTVLPIDLEYILDTREAHSFALVWRSSTELDPMTAYRLSVVVDHGAIDHPWVADLDLGLDLTTSAELIDPVEAPEVSAIQFHPGSRPVGERVCCESYLCTSGYYRCTESREEINVPWVSGTSSMTGQVARRGAAVVTVEVVLSNGSRVRLAETLAVEGEFAWSYDVSMLQGSLCGAATATSLIDGSTASTEVICPTDTDYGPITEQDADLGGWLGRCIADPFYEESGEPYEVDQPSSPGCRAHEHGSGWAFVLLGLTAARRSRRTAGEHRKGSSTDDPG